MIKKILNFFQILFILYCSASHNKLYESSEQYSPSSSPISETKSKEDSPKKSGNITTWKKGKQIPNTPKLFVGDKEELPLLGEEIRVQIDAFRARVLLDCYYLNNKGRVLEGNFKLQLPLEASPYYFAFGDTVYLDHKNIPFIESTVSGTRQISLIPEDVSKIRRASSQNLKEARVVPKEKALYAYEETVRKNVDPAILEWAGADVFTGRVFPLQQGKLHRISIGYDVNLLSVGKEMLHSLSLPEGKSPRIVHISAAKILKKLPSISGGLEWKEFAKRAELRLENPKENEITIRYPQGITLLQDSSKEPYFATRFTLDIPSKEENNKSYAVFAVDISKSSNPDKFNIWVELMRSILKNNRTTIPKFSVLFFNIETQWWKEEFVENTPDNLDKLLKYVNELALIGATDLQRGILEASNPHWYKEKRLPCKYFY